MSKIQIGESDKEDYFDTFINKSVKECNEDLRYFVNRKHAEKRQEMEQAKTMSKVANSENLFAIPSTPLTNVKNQTVPTLHSKENTSTINQKPFARSAVSRIFYGVCHCFFTHGRCLKTKCSYKHEVCFPCFIIIKVNLSNLCYFSLIIESANLSYVSI